MDKMNEDLIQCALKKDPEDISDLLSKGADLFVKNEDGENLLGIALRNKNFETFEYLLKVSKGGKKIDVNNIDNNGVTVLMRSFLSNRSEEVFELLVDAGLDVNIGGDTYETSLLQKAIRVDDAGMIIKLLRAGANPNLVDDELGVGLLHMFLSTSIVVNIHEVVDEFIKAGADLNLQTKEGFTPLMMAFKRPERLLGDINYKNHIIACSNMINSGLIDFSIRDKYGADSLSYFLRNHLNFTWGRFMKNVSSIDKKKNGIEYSDEDVERIRGYYSGLFIDNSKINNEIKNDFFKNNVDLNSKYLWVNEKSDIEFESNNGFAMIEHVSKTILTVVDKRGELDKLFDELTLNNFDLNQKDGMNNTFGIYLFQLITFLAASQAKANREMINVVIDKILDLNLDLNNGIVGKTVSNDHRAKVSDGVEDELIASYLFSLIPIIGDKAFEILDKYKGNNNRIYLSSVDTDGVSKQVEPFDVVVSLSDVNALNKMVELGFDLNEQLKTKGTKFITSPLVKWVLHSTQEHQMLDDFNFGANLIELGADVNLVLSSGDRAIALCSSEHKFNLLVSSGADVFFKNEKGENFLEFASKSPKNTIQYFKPLFEIYRKSNVDEFKLSADSIVLNLIKDSKDKSIKEFKPSIILINSIFPNELQENFKTGIELKNKERMLVRLNNDVEMAEQYLNGLVIQENIDEFSEKLKNAIEKRDSFELEIEAVKNKIKVGGDTSLLDYRDEFGNTPLLEATALGNIDFVEMCIFAGADINQKNNNDDNAILTAMLKDNYQVFEFLLKKGADIDAVNKNGESVRRLIGADEGFDRYVELLNTFESNNKVNNQLK